MLIKIHIHGEKYNKVFSRLFYLRPIHFRAKPDSDTRRDDSRQHRFDPDKRHGC